VRYGLPPTTESGRTKWILVGMEGRTVGLMVDQVTEVFASTDAELRPAPVLGGGEEERGIAGVTTHLGEMVFVLDLDRFDDLARVLTEPPARPGGEEIQ
jgi:purine-binding chemotaxis protein CheW